MRKDVAQSLETWVQKGGGEEKKNPLSTPPEYELDPLAFPLPDGGYENFCLGPRCETEREQLARPLPLHGSQLRPGEENTKANRSAPKI